MSAELTLTVALRGPDPVALTAQHALTHRLGYAGLLDEVGRRDVWRLTVEASGVAEALAVAGSWVTRSNLFVIPNKHVYELGAGRGPGGPQVAGGGGTPSGGVGRGGRGASRAAWVVTWSEPDLEGEAAIRLIRARFGGRELGGARKALAWLVRFTSRVDPADVLRLADEIAVARARTRGLLANPHFQSVAVVRAPSAAAAVEAAWTR
jgi:hypothetical protein